MPGKPKLPVETRRLRTLFISLPIMVATGCKYPYPLPPECMLDVRAVVLHKRLALEEPQRKLSRAPDTTGRDTR